MSEIYDLIVIGGGPGGYVAAIRAAQLGFTVAVIEKRNALGGTCLNEGCIPSKALLDSSELFVQARDKFAGHGILVEPPSLDLDKMMKRKQDIITRLTRGIASLFKKNQITLITGTGQLGAPATDGPLQVIASTDDGEQTLQGKRVLLATGSVAIDIPGLPQDGKQVGQARDALEYDSIPEHLVVIGGGYIGLELGSVWLRLGSKVTVVEMLEEMLPSTDKEVTTALLKSLKKQGMTIHAGTKVAGMEQTEQGVTLKLEGKIEESLNCDKVLVAVGRKPCIDGLGLDKAGVNLDEARRIAVDENYQTNIKNIFAIGDLIHGPMLAHKAMDEGVVFAEQWAGENPVVDYNLIPGVVYTHPEAASIGLTEEQLKEQGTAYKVGRFPFMASGRARAMDNVDGFVKVLANPDSGRILGVHIIGPFASELISEAVTIMAFDGSIEDVALTMHAHPTLSETFKEAALGAFGKAVHG
ncbi:MAG: dihydrolipoyl dehydrogenase [Deltaproteobacteria bacterium]|nr:MAG: dihydrolipoyl dehydrogenase [Deltaproteobacteria bacterium]